MANTIIQIKRSSTTTVPTSGTLTAAEPAYSYLSEKLFIGTSDGSGVIAIGGKFYVDLSNTIFNVANAAFLTANTGFTSSNLIFDAANAAFLNSNVGFNAANAAFLNSNVGFNAANAAFLNSNVSFAAANAAFLNSNVGFNAANAAFLNSNSAYNSANAGQLTANTAYDAANAAFLNSNVGFNAANSAYITANSAFDDSNTRLSTSGGTVTGDVSIVGDLVISGNTYVVDSETLRVSDPLIYLAGNNYVSDIVDIGFIANYVNSTGQNVHTGVYRDHSTKEYYIFQEYNEEPINNHIDPNGNNFTLAVLNADIRTTNLILSGTNTTVWIRSSYDAANAAFAAGNAAFLNSNVSFDAANAAFLNSNVGFNAANAAFLNSNVSFAAANAGLLTANVAYNAANGAFLNSNSAYDSANAAQLTANTAYDKANTANVNAGNASFLTVGTIPSGRVTGDYSGITGLGTIVSGTWNADIVQVTYGGTGRSSFTQNGILYGNTSGPINITSAGTEGQVLQAGASGIPQFGMLDGGNF
jgi:hypothetical protein